MNWGSISSVQSLSCVRLFVTPWTAARQVFLSFTISQSLLKLMSIESMMPSNHLIFCCHIFLLPSIFPSIKVFSSESALRIRWPKYWRLSFSISPFNEYSGLISSRTDCFDLLTVQRTVLLNSYLSRIMVGSARRSNWSILNEINPEYSLQGLMLKLKLQYFGHLMGRTDSLEKTLMLGKIEGRRRRRGPRG